MPLIEVDKEEVKVKGLKILTSNKLLTRLPVFLAQIKVGNHSYKLKNEFRLIVYLHFKINMIKSKIFTTI